MSQLAVSYDEDVANTEAKPDRFAVVRNEYNIDIPSPNMIIALLSASLKSLCKQVYVLLAVAARVDTVRVDWQ